MQKTYSRIGCALLLATAMSTALAADPPCYAILSLIGDKLDVAIYQPQTGSTLEGTRHVELPMTGPGIDYTAVTVAAQAVAKTVPGACLVQLTSSSPELYEKQREIFQEKNAAITLPAAIVNAMRKEKATQLILVTKFRDDARILMKESYVGAGALEGMGYYVDRSTQTRNLATGDAGRGFLAPFMYVKVSLVDAQSFKVTKEKIIKVTLSMSAGQAKETGHPWDALTDANKVRIMKQMISDELGSAVPELLKAQPSR
jgi:hypothetical protein